MLFDTGQFEHFFAERELKKGLRLSEKGAAEFLGRNPPFGYHFFVAKEEVMFRKKGNKILDWHCSCRKTIPCEHLACLMFVLHRGTLVLNRQVPRTGRKPATSVGKGDQHAGPEKLFISFKKRIDAALSTHLHLQMPEEQDIEEILRLLAETRTGVLAGKERGRDIVFDLAALVAVIPLFAKVPAGLTGKLSMLHHPIFTRLQAAYKSPNAEVLAPAWLAATLASLRNNRALYSPAFLFLVPRCLQLTSAAGDFEQIRHALYRRKYPLRNSGFFDPLAILRAMLTVIRHHVAPVAKGLQKQHAPEFHLAIAGLDFIEGHDARAFARLVAGAAELRQIPQPAYQEYIRYIMEQAREKNRPDLELKFLKEAMAYGLFIRPEDLARFYKLVPAGQAPAETEKLIRSLSPGEPGYFDKVSLLFMATEKYDELIAAISQQPECFSLLHTVVMKKKGAPAEKLLRLYIKHLLAALAKIDNTRMQQKMVDRAREYFDRLSDERKQELYEELLMQVGRNKPVYRYIEAISNDFFILPA